jgi:hypothetical protein
MNCPDPMKMKTTKPRTQRPARSGNSYGARIELAKNAGEWLL